MLTRHVPREGNGASVIQVGGGTVGGTIKVEEQTSPTHQSLPRSSGYRSASFGAPVGRLRDERGRGGGYPSTLHVTPPAEPRPIWEHPHAVPAADLVLDHAHLKVLLR